MPFRSTPRVAANCFIGVSLLYFLAVPSWGQGVCKPSIDSQGGCSSSTPPFTPIKQAPVYEVYGDERLVRVSVYAEDGKTQLDRQSVAKITNQSTHAVKWQTTEEKSETALGLPFGKYEIEISAVGYLSERKEFQVRNEVNTIRIELPCVATPPQWTLT